MTDDNTMRRPASAPTTQSKSPSLALWVAWSPAPNKTGTWLIPEKTATTVGRSVDAAHSFVGDRFMSRIAVRIAGAVTPEGEPAITIEPLPSVNATVLNLHPLATPAVVEEGDVLRLGTTVLVVAEMPPEPSRGDNLGLVGVSPQMERVRHHIRLWAKTPEPIHILGETGTGKELVASAIHRLSGRPGEFVSVNAAAIPLELADALLFGYRRGAFSGAERDHSGFFREAHRGTLFLDEVVELLPQVQAKLLRTIGVDTRVELQRVGDARPSEADVRLVTATHANITQRIFDGTFRQDLYHRLTARQLTLPPLRTRKPDISALVVHFIDTAGCQSLTSLVEQDIELSWHIADIMERFLLYGWPGNVRELRNQCLRIPETLEMWLRNGKPAISPFGHESGFSWISPDREAAKPAGENHVVPTNLLPSQRSYPKPREKSGLSEAPGGFGTADPSSSIQPPNSATVEPAGHNDEKSFESESDHFSDDEALPPQAAELINVMKNNELLTELIRNEFQGNVRSFAHYAAPLLHRKVENIRRHVYLRLGPEGMRKLREEK
ncbi:MAG: sigma 54-interacting transcriptional regulator [Myxococcales bacterium]|nr:sigma 54-interacting transcriptional regulator [Myxococcales bacterium]